jgi:hypothetical protein
MQEGEDNFKTAAGRASFRRRLFWLLACAALGLAVGFIGHSLSSNPQWFLALPAALAAGWLFFANPDECLASGRKDDGAA